MWKTGSKNSIDFSDIITILSNVSKEKNHKVIIGSDSVKFGSLFIFANAICIINDNKFYDRRYFYSRSKFKNNTYYNLYDRLLKETSDSIMIASLIKEKLDNINIEIHLDINSDSNHRSFKYKNLLVGYVKGSGFSCKIKPDSFVASGLADVHTRKS